MGGTPPPVENFMKVINIFFEPFPKAIQRIHDDPFGLFIQKSLQVGNSRIL